MDHKRYRRYFIILDGEDGGFDNKQGKNPKGYTKIEIKNGKGVLSYYVQNLKYFDKAEYVYRGYLIGTKDGKKIYAENGTFLIDESGKGELNWRFDAENVDGRDNAINDFNVIAIVAEEMDRGARGKELRAPLVGFIDKEKVSWKHVLLDSYHVKEKTQEDLSLVKQYEEKLEEIVEVIEEGKEEVVETVEVEDEAEAPQVSTGNEEGTVEVASVDHQEEIESIKEEHAEKFRKEPKEEVCEPKEEFKEKKEEIKEEKKEEIKEKKVEEKEKKVEEKEKKDMEYEKMKSCGCKHPHMYYHHYFKMVCDYVKNILKYYPKVEPFERNIKGYNWWRIDCSPQTLYRNFLPFYGYASHMHYCHPYMNWMMGYPDLMSKYQHYIFGIVNDEKNEPLYYTYGVPGRFILREQPYEGMTGFIYWHPIQDKKIEKGDYGYWILHIDAKTGNVVTPLEPTPPPRY